MKTLVCCGQSSASFRSRTAVTLGLLALCVGVAHATPHIPLSDDVIVERLPAAIQQSAARQSARLRRQLVNNPADLDAATELAWQQIALGRGSGDPRFHGYAEAALAPWWGQTDAPPAVLLLRATINQNRHDFAAADTDLKRLLKRQPRNAQAWVTLAVVQLVRGQHAESMGSCVPLFRLANPLLATTCDASARSAAGYAEHSYQRLLAVLAASPDANPKEQLWALTVLAEIALQLGRPEAAEKHFKRAIDLRLRDIYLLAAYADFLLDHNRPAKVLELLRDETVDALLLRKALAESNLGLPGLERSKATLAARIQAARRRGEGSHLATRSRFALALGGDAGLALQLALENWSRQKQASDVRLVLQAAAAANAATAAKPVLRWLERSRLQDQRLLALRQALTEQTQ